MRKIKFNSYILGIFCNPFAQYAFDFNGYGTLEMKEGLFSYKNRRCDLYNIKAVENNISFTQHLFGLGTVTCEMTNGNVLVFENIKKSRLLTKLLNAHREDLLETKVENVLHHNFL